MKPPEWTVAAAIVVVTALATPGVAAATKEDYLYDLRNSGINGPDNSLITLGNGACRDNRDGITRDASVNTIKQNSGLGDYDAKFLYLSAMQFLCS